MPTPRRGADFLISYAAADEPWFIWLAEVLEDAGFSAVGEAWELRARGGFVVDLDAALERAERVLALVSRDYVRETFCVPSLM